jgi:hypothetical protein
MAEGVLFSDDAAQRIANATRWVEANNGPDVPPADWYGYVPDDTAAGTLIVSKITADWDFETSQTLTVYEGTPPGETATKKPRTVKAWNRIGKVRAGKWVLAGLAHIDQDGKEVWYLVARETAEKEIDVIVDARLDNTGLVLVRKTVRILEEITPPPSVITIPITECPPDAAPAP